jgi:hypothetical protein
VAGVNIPKGRVSGHPHWVATRLFLRPGQSLFSHPRHPYRGYRQIVGSYLRVPRTPRAILSELNFE